jgi:hypothetical protein
MISKYHETAVGEIKQLYILRNEAEIVGFLEAHTTLYTFLQEVFPVLHDYFPDEPLALEIIFDPDEEEIEVLFIYIETSQEVDEALNILNQFTQRYWINLPIEIRDLLEVDVDFV